MSGTQIANPHHAEKNARTLNSDMVGKNLDLYVGSEDGLVTVGYGINNKLSPTDFLEFEDYQLSLSSNILSHKTFKGKHANHFDTFSMKPNSINRLELSLKIVSLSC